MFFQVIGKTLDNLGLSTKAKEILLSAWKKSTQNQYSIYLKQWFNFCSSRNEDPFHSNPQEIIEFLTVLFENIGYSALSTAKAALGTFVTLQNGQTLSQNQLISKFMKGVFNKKPPTPRYSSTWDVKIVLDFLRSLSPLKKLTLRQLTLKTTMLIALTSSQRQQTIHMLDIQQMEITGDSVTFQIDTLLKHNRPGRIGTNLSFSAYDEDKKICVYTHIVEYLRRTKYCRGKETRLFVSFKKPHHKVTRDTIARWLKTIMTQAGIDTTIYKPHSTRTASVSKAMSMDVPVQHILKHAGWASEKTFQRFYNKPILCKESSSVTDAILSNE